MNLYPFVRVWWKAGKVDKAESGDYWDGKSSKGYTTFINKLKSLLKNYKPDEQKPETTPTPTPEPETPTTNESSNDGCNGNDCNSNCNGGCSPDSEQKVAKLIAKTKEVESKLAALSAELDAVKADAKSLLCELTDDSSCKA